MQTCSFLSNVSSDISEKVVKAVLSNVNSVSSVAVFVAVLPTSLVFLRLLISFLQMKRERSREVKYTDIGTYRFQFSDIGASGASSKNPVCPFHFRLEHV